MTYVKEHGKRTVHATRQPRNIIRVAICGKMLQGHVELPRRPTSGLCRGCYVALKIAEARGEEVTY